MLKPELVKLVAEQERLTLNNSEAAVNTIFNAIAGSLEIGRRVELRGFGSFGLKEHCARVGRNPKTGEAVAIEAKRVLFFKTGKALRKRVDGGSTKI